MWYIHTQYVCVHVRNTRIHTHTEHTESVLDVATPQTKLVVRVRPAHQKQENSRVMCARVRARVLYLRAGLCVEFCSFSAAMLPDCCADCAAARLTSGALGGGGLCVFVCTEYWYSFVCGGVWQCTKHLTCIHTNTTPALYSLCRMNSVKMTAITFRMYRNTWLTDLDESILI